MGNKISKLNPSLKFNYLITGYVRNIYCDQFELWIIRLISQFMTNIFITFDIIPSQLNNKKFIFDNGKVFKRSKYNFGKGDDDNIGPFTFGCSIGWMNGDEYKLSIKSLTSGYELDTFGITSNINKLCSICDWYTNIARTYNDDIIIYSMEGNKLPTPFDNIKSDNILFHSCHKCKPNDIITIYFNGNNWTVTFLINNKIQGNPIKIKQNLIYSPFISSNGSSYKGIKYCIVE